MEIKLKRPLWNHKTGEKIIVNDKLSSWALNKGYAEQIDENKAIVPEYKKRGRKSNAN